MANSSIKTCAKRSAKQSVRSPQNTKTKKIEVITKFALVMKEPLFKYLYAYFCSLLIKFFLCEYFEGKNC